MPPPRDDLFYTVEDFNVGNQMVFHGRVFQITVSIPERLSINLTSFCSFESKDCDEFTQKFLIKMGVRVGAPVECPTDPFSKFREEVRVKLV